METRKKKIEKMSHQRQYAFGGIRKCVVCGAKGTKDFHTFPKSEAQRKKWLNRCIIESIKERDRICFRHFKSDDYFPRRSDNQMLKLKRFVVPSRNIPKVSKWVM